LLIDLPLDLINNFAEFFLEPVTVTSQTVRRFSLRARRHGAHVRTNRQPDLPPDLLLEDVLDLCPLGVSGPGLIRLSAPTELPGGWDR